jgi:hypothetical protein
MGVQLRNGKELATNSRARSDARILVGIALFLLLVLVNAVALILIYGFAAGYYGRFSTPRPWNFVLASGALLLLLTVDVEAAFGWFGTPRHDSGP